MAAKKVLILAPRLDVMFKEGPMPTARGPIPEIRTHWANFVVCVEQEHLRRGDNVTVLELPLWQFNPAMVNEAAPDVVYIPHKERRSFPVDPAIDARYYMQSVFPWRFYVDSMGWAGGASGYPFNKFVLNGDANAGYFEALQSYALSNGSKFEQPPIRKNLNLPDNYVFFPCQIPHDETIKYHSDVTVEMALAHTCEITASMNLPLVVKGHPVNPGSMATLYSICTKYPHTIWVDDVSIHDLIPKSRAVVVVNSGTGMESLLHLKPVVTFGRAEYDVVTMNAGLGGELKTMLTLPHFNLNNVKKFFNSWCTWTYDTRSPSDFNKLV